MSDFVVFNDAIKKQIAKMSKSSLFAADVTGRDVWDMYLESFAEGDDPMFKERTEHDCNCCKQYIRKMGNVVSVNKDLSLSTIWDVNVGGRYQVVADALSAYVKASYVSSIFLSDTKHVGSEITHSSEGGEVLTWEHFGVQLDPTFVVGKDSIPTKAGHARSNTEVFRRAMEELTMESATIIKDLIAQKSLYRGEEHKRTITTFIKYKKLYGKLTTEYQKNNFCWEVATELGGAAKMRNSVIGSLLIDISEGVDLERAVKAFETKVAPANYKRPSALITKGMIEKAQAKVAELGIADSLQRRYAVLDDITINNVLFADRSVKKKMDVFDELVSDVSVNKKKLGKVEEVSVDTFIKDILPTATSLELLVENTHTANLVSLIAPENVEAPSILKWDNNFSWVYNGEVTDSIAERVKSAGGNVKGVLRCSLAWFNKDDLDIHMNEPNGKHIYYRSKSSTSSGNLDVDANAGTRHIRNAVENISYSSKAKMREGDYVVSVHNYSKRESIDVGFELEVEYDGVVQTFVYNRAVGSGKKIEAVVINYTKAGGFKIKKSIKASTASKEVWGINTNQFHRVDMAMMSPNHWDENVVGNKHYMFMLENCINPDDTRGLYNEFLSDKLTENRKVFEVLGSKMRVEQSDQQISGLGFSSTQRNSVVCKVGGTFNRTIKIKF